MIQKKLVSIIINCYNGEEYLRDALDSILAQTYTHWEVIFWDNQSTDKSAEIFKSYQDSRFLYYHAPKHTWLYEARNLAVEKTKGDYIAFLDVDDMWLPKKLESQLMLFADENIGLVAGDYFEYYEPLKKKQLFTVNVPDYNKLIESLLLGNYIGMFTIIVRSSALKELVPPFDSNYHIIGDFDMLIRLFEKWKLGWVHEPVGLYRIHGNNESLKRKKMQIDEELDWINKMKDIKRVSVTKAFAVYSTMAQYKEALYYASEKKVLLAIKKANKIRSFQLRMRCVAKCMFIFITQK